MATQRETVVYADSQGNTTAHLLTTVAGAAAVRGLILAKSNADWVASWEGPLLANGSPAPTASAYIAVTTEAVLTFTTAAGNFATVRIPAPQTGIFKADGFTVDPAQITALIAQVLTDIVTANGTALTAYVSGVRSES
jgi:hypothetical protein